MVEYIKDNELDWHRNKVIANPMRGTRVLVSYAISNNHIDTSNYGSVKTRCVWPRTMLGGDSKFLSRRIQGQVLQG